MCIRDRASAIPLLQILALGGILFPLHVINLNVLKAMGHSGSYLKVEIIKKVVGATMIILGARFGIMGMAWAVVISSFFAFGFNAYYNGKFLRYGMIKQIKDCLPALTSGIIMAAIVIACDHAISGPPPLRLVILSITGAIAFMLMAKIFKIAELSEAISFIQKHVHIRRPSTL